MAMTDLTNTPITILMQRDRGKSVQIIAEVICHKVPVSIRKQFPYLFAEGNTAWLLHRLWVHKDCRRKRLAHRMLNDLLHIADHRGVNLCLRVMPFEAQSLSAEQLVKLYKAYGFFQAHPKGEKWRGVMIRTYQS